MAGPEPSAKRLKTDQAATTNTLHNLHARILKGQFKSATSLLHAYMQQEHRDTPVYTCRHSSGYIFQIIAKGKILSTGEHPLKKNEAKRIAAENALSSLCPELFSAFNDHLHLRETDTPEDLGTDAVVSTDSNFLSPLLQRVRSGDFQSYEALLHEALLKSQGQTPNFFSRVVEGRTIVEISLNNQIVASAEDVDKTHAKEKAIRALLGDRFFGLLSAFENYQKSLPPVCCKSSEKGSVSRADSVFKLSKDAWERMSQKLEKKIKSRAIRTLGSLLHEICQQAGTNSPLYSWESGPDNEYVSVITINQSVIGRGSSAENKTEAKNKALEMALSTSFPNLITMMSLCQNCPDLICSDSGPTLPTEFVTLLTSAMYSSNSPRPSNPVNLWENDLDNVPRLNCRTSTMSPIR